MPDTTFEPGNIIGSELEQSDEANEVQGGEASPSEEDLTLKWTRSFETEIALWFNSNRW